MDKQVLSEINRSREIMGLGQLIREQSQAYADDEQVKIWVSSDGKDSSGRIAKMLERFTKVNLTNQTIDGDNIWTALNTAFYNITGSNIVDETGEGTNAAFGGKGQFDNGIYTGWYGKGSGKNRPLVLLGDGTLRVDSSELALSRDNPIKLDDLLDKINTFNVDNAGTEQLIKAGLKTRYKRNGNTNSIISEKVDNRLYLWSTKYQKSTREVTKDEIVQGKDVAGDVLNEPLSDSYDDLVINIKDTSKVDDIKAQMEAHVEQGGTVDSVTITSTASDTGLDPKKMSDFSAMMTKAGFSEYSNVSTTAGGEMEFTMEDKIDTTDKALAVVRGKLLARLLGVEDKANYKFAITSGAKVVNVSVKGTSPATPGEDKTIKGKVDDKLTQGDKGSSSAVYAYIMKIKMVKRGVVSKIGDKIGTSKSSRNKRKA